MEAINGKEKVFKKQEANKEEDARGKEKETMEIHGLAYKGVRHAQRHPLKTEFELSSLQGKHLEQEQESQGARSSGKNQAQWIRATGQPPKKEFDLSKRRGKNLEQEQESQGTLPRKKNQVRKTGRGRAAAKTSRMGLSTPGIQDSPLPGTSKKPSFTTTTQYPSI